MWARPEDPRYSWSSDVVFCHERMPADCADVVANARGNPITRFSQVFLEIVIRRRSRYGWGRQHERLGQSRQLQTQQTAPIICALGARGISLGYRRGARAWS